MRLSVTIVAIFMATQSHGANIVPFDDVTFQGDTYTVDVDPYKATGDDQFWSDYTYSVETPGSSNPSGEYFVERTVTNSNQFPGSTTNGPHQTRYDETGIYDVGYSLEATSILRRVQVCDSILFGGSCRSEVREFDRDGAGSVDFTLGVFPKAFEGLDGYYYGAVGDTFPVPLGLSVGLFPFLESIPRLLSTQVVTEIDGIVYTRRDPLTLSQPGFQTITVDYSLLSYVNAVEESCGLAFCTRDARTTLDPVETTSQTYGVFIVPGPAVVPLPASLPLLLVASGAFFALRRRAIRA